MKIGDRVKFLNEAGGGVIKGIIDKETVMILSDDEFEMPMLKTELIVVSDNNEVQSFVARAEPEVAKPLKKAPQQEEVLLAFVPEAKDYVAYLVNNTNYLLFSTVYERMDTVYHGKLATNIEAQSKLKLDTYGLSDLENLESLDIQLLLYQKHGQQLPSPIAKSLKIDTKKLVKKSGFRLVESLGEEALCLQLFPAEAKALSATELKEKIEERPHPLTQTIKKKERKTPSDILEVDLHIHQLLDSTQGMSNNDMLDHQLATFRKVLEQEKKNKGKKIVFIHGVGNGVLKQRLRHELQGKYPYLYVQDASFQQYGWGATMVIIK